MPSPSPAPSQPDASLCHSSCFKLTNSYHSQFLTVSINCDKNISGIININYNISNISINCTISINCNTSAEFLKAAIMQSHDCANFLRFCANFGLMNANQEKTGTSVVCLPQFNNVF